MAGQRADPTVRDRFARHDGVGVGSRSGSSLSTGSGVSPICDGSGACCGLPRWSVIGVLHLDADRRADALRRVRWRRDGPVRPGRRQRGRILRGDRVDGALRQAHPQVQSELVAPPAASTCRVGDRLLRALPDLPRLPAGLGERGGVRLGGLLERPLRLRGPLPEPAVQEAPAAAAALVVDLLVAPRPARRARRASGRPGRGWPPGPRRTAAADPAPGRSARPARSPGGGAWPGDSPAGRAACRCLRQAARWRSPTAGATRSSRCEGTRVPPVDAAPSGRPAAAGRARPRDRPAPLARQPRSRPIPARPVLIEKRRPGLDPGTDACPRTALESAGSRPPDAAPPRDPPGPGPAGSHPPGAAPPRARPALDRLAHLSRTRHRRMTRPALNRLAHVAGPPEVGRSRGSPGAPEAGRPRGSPGAPEVGRPVSDRLPRPGATPGAPARVGPPAGRPGGTI